MARILLRGEEPTTAETFQRVAKLYSPEELKFAQRMLREGRLDGGRYRAVNNNCGCFFGVMAVSRVGLPSDDDAVRRQKIVAMELSNDGNAILLEQFFGYIFPGDKPKNSKYALKADRWFTKAITGKAV